MDAEPEIELEMIDEFQWLREITSQMNLFSHYNRNI